MRLNARYTQFWGGFTYRHFWTSAEFSGAASGELITAAASIISGQASAGASLGGQVLPVAIEFYPGLPSQDASAPGNTRLNATYRHFWNRRMRWRHFWTQWEGAGISGSLADGDLVVASLAVIVKGQASGNANQAGDNLNTIASIISGEARGAAHSDGALYTISTSIAESGAISAGVNLAGQILVTQASIPSGVAFGSVMQADTSITAGEAIVPPNVLATIGDTLVVNASIIPGAALSGVQLDGAILNVQILLVSGTATADGLADGALLQVSAALIAGAAIGEGAIEPPVFVRGMPPAFKLSKGSKDAQVFGAMILAGVRLNAGHASGEQNAVVLPLRKSEFTKPAVQVLRSEVSVEVSGAVVDNVISLFAGAVSVAVVAPGAIIEDYLVNDDRDFDILFAA